MIWSNKNQDLYAKRLASIFFTPRAKMQKIEKFENLNFRDRQVKIEWKSIKIFKKTIIFK